MTQSWADEEDKIITKYESTHGKNNNNSGNDNYNNKQGNCLNKNNYSGTPNRKRKPDNTIAAIERPSKDNNKNNSDSPNFTELLKQK